MALSKFLDVQNDIAFKRIFGTERNKDFCFVFIELPKFSKKREIVEKWIYFFKYAAETRESDLERIIGSDETCIQRVR